MLVEIEMKMYALYRLVGMCVQMNELLIFIS